MIAQINDLVPLRRRYRIRLMIHSRRHAFPLLFAAAVLTAVFLAVRLSRLRGMSFAGAVPSPAASSSSAGVSRPSYPRLSAGHASAVSPSSPPSAVSVPDAAAVIRSRYRLAGVTLNGLSPDRSLAIVEERETGRQRRLRPGDDLDDTCRLSVVRTNSVLLTTSRGMVALFAERASAVPSPAPAFAPVPEDDVAAVMRKFGATRVDTNTWDFSRETMMDYYRELLARPERLVKVFDSLAPVYGDDAKIEGYRVDVQGERDFFRAIGLRQGDVVRSVNGIDMTSRRRAEGLIRRYAADDLDSIVIELDRDGRREKQYYHSSRGR